MTLTLIIPAFIAGLLTFLAPCTLPLVPAYLGFISGVSAKDLQHPEKTSKIRKRVLTNALFYIVGFSSVFILLGLLFGLGGAALVHYRIILSRIGGVFILFFAAYLLGLFERSKRFSQWFSQEHRFVLRNLHPGSPLSAFLFGATFAFGWTPCIGPILGSVLLLASTTATVVQGAFLLLVFSTGLAVPFLVLALGIAHAAETVKTLNRFLPYVSFLGGIFLLILGILLVTDSLSLWLEWVYQAFQFINYDVLLRYL